PASALGGVNGFGPVVESFAVDVGVATVVAVSGGAPLDRMATSGTAVATIAIAPTIDASLRGRFAANARAARAIDATREDFFGVEAATGDALEVATGGALDVASAGGLASSTRGSTFPGSV